MSIRTISQLPLLDIQDVIYNKNVDKTSFRNSLVEVSYNESEGKYKSMRMKLGDYYDYVYYNILSGGDEGKTTFNTSVDFTQLVNMYKSLNLSGNFTVNWDVPDEDVDNLSIYMKAGHITLYGTQQNTFISPYTKFSTDEIDLFTFNDIHYGHISHDDTWLCTDFTLYGDDTINGDLFVNGSGYFRDDLKCDGNGGVGGDLTVGGDSTVGGDLTVGGDIHGKNFYGGMFYGCALCALWADLAETYESDRDYDSGTLVRFGGEREITIAHDEANAVVTTNPGLILNSDRHGCQIALVGRTPVKVVGKVRKFDKIYLCPFNDGVGASLGFIKSRDPDYIPRSPIGRALQSSDDEKIKLVECVVKMNV